MKRIVIRCRALKPGSVINSLLSLSPLAFLERRMQSFWQDLRYGARMLLKQKGVTAIASISLALGIGANTALFSVVDAMLLKKLPVKEPDRLVLFGSRAPRDFS